MSNPVYPTLSISQQSRRTMRDGRQEDVTSDGSTRVRKLHADKFDFEVVHPGLTSADVTTLETFYNTYGTSSAIDFTWPEDGQVYTVRFGREAMDRRWSTPTRRTITVRLVGV